MREGCAWDRAAYRVGRVDVHFDPEVTGVACPGYLHLAVPIADRFEEKIYFGLGAGRDTDLTRGVCVARRRLNQLPIVVENGNVYAERFFTKVDRAADDVVAVQTRRQATAALFCPPPSSPPPTQS